MEKMSNYRKVAGYKVNTQKSIVFLYNSNEQLEFEIGTIPHAVAFKRIKYPE